MKETDVAVAVLEASRGYGRHAYGRGRDAKAVAEAMAMDVVVAKAMALDVVVAKAMALDVVKAEAMALDVVEAVPAPCLWSWPWP